MPDQDNPTPTNAFDPDYLRQLDQHDDPVTAGEAVTGGFWRVVPLGDERYGLFRMWERPEDGDEPFGTLTDRDTALLAAAFLPLVDRARSFSVDSEDAAPGGVVLYRDGRAVGRIRHGNPELTEALNLADGLARSPASIASFLEAAGAAALELAGKILVRRI
ncbi:MAG TPA: hypothetical protein VGG06_13300 [Thermoanaerobaculia bacterium]|jgi:hypothetical protein